MNLKFYCLLLAAAFLLGSCAAGRVLVYFLPSTKDYKIFPLDTLHKAPPRPTVWDTSQTFQLPPLHQWLAPRYIHHYCKKDSTSIDEFIKNTGTTSLLIARNDSILYRKYANGYQPQDPQVVFSVSKALVSTLVAIAIEEGKMSMDQSIADFIPEFCEDDRSRITVRHLLNMTSGIRWMDNQDLFKLSFLYYSLDLKRFVIHRTPLKYAPGTHFSYKSIGTQLLGMCLEKAVGMRSSEYMQQKLWIPLGMEDDGFFTMDSRKHRNNRAYGGIALSSRDMLRFGKLFENMGNWQGKQIVPRWWVEELSDRKIEMDKWWGYANCWWRNGYMDGNFLDGTDYFAAGFKEQYIYINPEYNMVMVRTGDSRDSGPSWPVTFGRLAQLINEGSNDFTDPDKDFSEQFEGVYETKRGERLEVVFHGRKDYQERSWSVWKDVHSTLKMTKAYDLYQVDGQSLTYRNYGRQIRLVYEVIDGKVVGLYFSDLFEIDSQYFAKTTSKLSPRLRKLSKLQ